MLGISGRDAGAIAAGGLVVGAGLGATAASMWNANDDTPKDNLKTLGKIFGGLGVAGAGSLLWSYAIDHAVTERTALVGGTAAVLGAMAIGTLTVRAMTSSDA